MRQLFRISDRTFSNTKTSGLYVRNKRKFEFLRSMFWISHFGYRKSCRIYYDALPKVVCYNNETYMYRAAIRDYTDDELIIIGKKNPYVRIYASKLNLNYRIILLICLLSCSIIKLIWLLQCLHNIKCFVVYFSITIRSLSMINQVIQNRQHPKGKTVVEPL